jgi:iron complex transport system permease protein
MVKMISERSAPPLSNHRSKSHRNQFRLVLVLSIVFLLISAIGALCLGPIRISVDSVVKTLCSPAYRNLHPVFKTVVCDIRLPRIVLAAVIGAALAASGAGFQSLLRNDLADPYILGISSGASTAVAAVTLFSIAASVSLFIVPAASLLGAIAVLVVVLALSSKYGRIDSRSLLLNGVIISAFLWAIEMAALHFAGHDFEEILNWLMGSLAAANWLTCIGMSVVTLLCFGILMYLSPWMNLYSIGEESARQLGLEAERFKKILVVTSTILAAAAVAAVGIIGFIGLISPHIARTMLKTPDHRLMLPIASICGAILLVWSDTFARILFGADTLPVGIITAFLGAPFFCYQLRRR